MIVFFFFSMTGFAQKKFDGLDMNMGNLSKLSDAKSRSISPENFTGAKGKGGMADPKLDSGKGTWPMPRMLPRTWARVGR